MHVQARDFETILRLRSKLVATALVRAAVAPTAEEIVAALRCEINPVKNLTLVCSHFLTQCETSLGLARHVVDGPLRSHPQFFLAIRAV